MGLSAIGGDRLSELYMLLILFTVLIVDKVDQDGSDPWMILCFIYWNSGIAVIWTMLVLTVGLFTSISIVVFSMEKEINFMS